MSQPYRPKATSKPKKAPFPVSRPKLDKKFKPVRNPKKTPSDDQYIYKKKKESDHIEIFRQDLVNVGVAIWEHKQETEGIMKLVEEFPDIFEPQKRPVMFNFDEPSNLSINSKSKILKKEDLKSEYDYLADNEEIPDWYEPNPPIEVTFDFGNTVSKGMALKKETSKAPEDNKAKNFEILPEEIDRMLEELVSKNQNSKNSIEDLEDKQLFNADSESEHSEEKEEPEKEEQSQEYFKDLHNNIKKMLFSHSEARNDQEEEEDNKSFELQKQIFTDNNDSDYSKPTISNIVKEEPIIEDQEPQVNHDEEIEKYIKTLPPELQERQQEHAKLTEDELKTRNKYFLENYGFLDMVINKIVYDLLNSKKRPELNKLSAHGFNQNFVEKFCRDPYKIFSLYMQGMIFEKLWRYKNPNEEVQGPFMSYDMDLFNDSNTVFTSKTMISFNDTNLFPINMFIYRAPIVEDMIQNYLASVRDRFQAQRGGGGGQRQQHHDNRKRNQHHQDKKVNFYKKKGNSPKPASNFNKNLTDEENFPKLEYKEDKNDSPLLTALLQPKSSNTQQSKPVEVPKKNAKEEFPTLETALKEEKKKSNQQKAINQWDDEDEANDKSNKDANFVKKNNPESQDEVTSNLKKMLGL